MPSTAFVVWHCLTRCFPPLCRSLLSLKEELFAAATRLNGGRNGGLHSGANGGKPGSVPLFC